MDQGARRRGSCCAVNLPSPFGVGACPRQCRAKAPCLPAAFGLTRRLRWQRCCSYLGCAGLAERRALALRPLARRSGGRADAPLLPTATCALRCIIDVLDMDGDGADPGCRYGMLGSAQSRLPTWLHTSLALTPAQGQRRSASARCTTLQAPQLVDLWRRARTWGVPRWLGHCEPALTQVPSSMCQEGCPSPHRSCELLSPAAQLVCATAQSRGSALHLSTPTQADPLNSP